MITWGEFYALVPLEELREIAAGADDDAGKGDYPDALWFHHGRERLEHQRGRYIGAHPANHAFLSRHSAVEMASCWGWTRCRIATARGGGFAMSLPGVDKPVEVPATLVFRGEDFRKELERRAGTLEVPAGSTMLTMPDTVLENYSVRREIASIDMVLELLDGRSPVPTLKHGRNRGLLRNRERREVAHVQPQPTVLAEMLKWVRMPRKGAKRAPLPASEVTGQVLPGDTVRLTYRLAPDSRKMLHGKPVKSRGARLTGNVVTPPLPWEERSFDIGSATGLELAQGLLEMCGDIDLDFHRSASAVAGEIMRTGHFAVTIQSLHRLRGGEGPCGQQDRARYSRHLGIMRGLEVEVDMPDGRGILAIPFAAGGARVLDSETRAVKGASLHAVPDSIVGMMLAEGGHRWQYWLDTRVQRVQDDLAYSLHHFLARQWAARMTRHAVEGETRHAYRLDTVLDSTPLRKIWRTRLKKQGKPWLRGWVNKGFTALHGVGLYGAAGTARVEWNEEDIGASMMVFGEPPPHILEAHADRNSRRIAGAKKKRLRLDTHGDTPKGGRVGKGKG